MKLSYFFALILVLSCNASKISNSFEESYDEASLLAANAEHEKARMRYKLIQSKFLDKKKLQKNIQKQLKGFSQEDYERLKDLIYEKDIHSLQQSIKDGNLSYKLITQWFLFRINKYEIDPNTSLHCIISINPRAVEHAEQKDAGIASDKHPIYGMPILLKDNVNASGMPTTAGALALSENYASNAFIVDKLEANGAIILGKVNLSEWAYFFCSGCPVGYSAVGGQTLNPYGRTIFESGGSSSGSGASIAASYAVGAVGTETSGSILSPSSQNSLVGLKPTVGSLSRSGIVPISSTLDTPGPMTRTVTDNAILFSAMTGFDQEDAASIETINDFYSEVKSMDLEGLRLGANKKYMDEFPLYAQMMLDLNRMGVEIYGFDPKEVKLEGFLSILNIDMRNDLPVYLNKYAGEKVTVSGIKSVLDYNRNDMEIRAPYGQALFEGILEDSTSKEELKEIVENGRQKARSFFDEPINEFNLSAISSINNYDAGRAALAHYPALTIPMGYKENGEPMNLTLIAASGSEQVLYKIAYAIEEATLRRVPPSMK